MRHAPFFIRINMYNTLKNAAPPNLVDPGTRYYVSETLQRCHSTRVNIYYWIMNITVVVVIGLILACFVYLAWSKRTTPEEHRQKLVKDHEAVLKQIRVYRNEQNRIHQFTTLPTTGEYKRGEQSDTMREVFQTL